MPSGFKAKDNARGNLDSSITASSLSIALESGDGASFPQPYTGAATSGGTSALLNCTGIGASGVQVGDTIHNVTDGSVARIESLATDSATTTALKGGSDNTWQNSDVWRVNEFVVAFAAINSDGEDTKYEEALVTNRATDTLTVPSGGRGYNGTVAQSFDAGDHVQLRVVAPYHEDLKSMIHGVSKATDTNTGNIATNTAAIAAFSSTSPGAGASQIGLADQAGDFDATNVEDAIAELQAAFETFVTIPAGGMVLWTTNTAPTGWLLCYGQAVSRATYADLFAALVPSLGTFTVNLATPAVFTKTAHGLTAGDAVYFTTTGALPTGLTASTIYYVISSGLTANEFQVSATRDGSAINTSVSQSGVHTVWFCPFGLGNGSTTFNIPDMRGRMPLGQDDMGGSAASRITSDSDNPTALGGASGSQNHAHTIDPDNTAINRSGGGADSYGYDSNTTKPTSTVSSMPPYLTLNYIIKT